MNCRRTIAVLFLLIASAPVLFAFNFLLKQQLARERMQEALEETLLTVICLPADNLQWTRGEKELVIEGKLFDVKKFSRLPNGDIRLEGLFDESETALLELMEKQQKQEENNTGSQLTDFFQHWTALNTASEIAVRVCFNKPLFGNNHPELVKVDLSIIAPPPRI